MLEFVLVDHLRLALDAALLFAVGLFVSWPVVHYRLKAIARLPLAVFRLVLGLIGRSPGIPRMAGAIWGFNSVAIFVYMASGCHPLLPKLFGIWVGMNIGIIMGMAPHAEDLLQAGMAAPGQWVPPPLLSTVSGALVLVLELPCFWFAIAMGIRMGQAVQSGQPYLSALAPRATAYVCVIVPVLAFSAVCEAVAIRGSAGRGSHHNDTTSTTTTR